VDFFQRRTKLRVIDDGVGENAGEWPMTVIELPDDQAVALKAKASAQGLQPRSVAAEAG
jgi:hypothetical protein